jgi:cytidine deaminase
LISEDQLVQAALAGRLNAVAPYSHFLVGAALETAGGEVVTGCNVENATYGLTVCAERIAIFKALSDGHRKFGRIAVAADTDVLTPPCGACRQIIWEFCGDIPVVLANLKGVRERFAMKDLFPRAFDSSFLGET